jgi:hypothetical protein
MIGRFVSECCELETTAKMARKTLQDACVAWAEEAGERPPSAKALATWLQDHGVIKGSVRTAAGTRDGWKGIRLRALTDMEEDGKHG